jgi:signal transduction histidine kinase
MSDRSGQSVASADTAHTADTGEAALRRALAESEALVGALRAQQEALAYGISHDLRAPLRTIDAYSALLERGAANGLDDAGRDHLARIRGATARMGALLDSLLEYSRVDRGDLARVPVDLGLLADVELAALQDLAPDRAVHAGIAPGLVAFGDERLLRMLMVQLVRNAWNFSGDDVVLDVDGARDGETLRIAVRDAGSGFDPRYADRIFEPFQRLHLPEQGAGAGLGLAIAARIVARHGGRLHAESTPGSGSVFHVELPAAATGSSA